MSHWPFSSIWCCFISFVARLITCKMKLFIIGRHSDTFCVSNRGSQVGFGDDICASDTLQVRGCLVAVGAADQNTILPKCIISTIKWHIFYSGRCTHTAEAQLYIQTTYWSGITLIVSMPRLAASWMTALPTGDLASFWIITSPLDKEAKSARSRNARHEEPLIVAACSTGISSEIFCTEVASATTFWDHVPAE